MEDTRRRRRPSRRTVVIALLLLAAATAGALWWLWHVPTVPFVQTIPPGERQVNVLALGDWGDDTWAQARVAEGMASYRQARVPNLDGVLSLGDNFYVRLTGVDDPEWGRLFERMFDPVRLNVPFYVLLGNHDYSRGRQDRFELEYPKKNPQSRWKMPARWYRLELPSADDPLVTVLMLDGNHLFLSKEEWREQAAWIAAELAKPRTARWLVMCAHQPLYTNGGHGDEPRLLREWGPLLEPNAVDFYLSAHDHNLQHVRVPGVGTTFVVSGGGGANLHDIIRTDRGPFAEEMHGFAHLRFGGRSADVHLLAANGRPVHAFSVQPLWPTTTPTTTPTTMAVSADVAQR